MAAGIRREAPVRARVAALTRTGPQRTIASASQLRLQGAALLQARDFEPAVTFVRRTGLRPTFPRLAVAKLLLDGCGGDVEDIVSRAQDEGLPLTVGDATPALRELLDAAPAGQDPGTGEIADPEGVSDILKAIANPWRLRILCMLTRGERSVGEIGEVLGIAQSALSQHLGRLREQGLVSTRRDRQRIFYTLSAPAALPAVLKAVCTLSPGAAASSE